VKFPGLDISLHIPQTIMTESPPIHTYQSWNFSVPSGKSTVPVKR